MRGDEGRGLRRHRDGTLEVCQAPGVARIPTRKALAPRLQLGVALRGTDEIATGVHPACRQHEPPRQLARQLAIGAVAVAHQNGRQLLAELGEQHPRGPRAACGVDVHAHRVRAQTHPQPAARIVPALAAHMNHPARLVALDQARRTLALGNRLIKGLEHPQQPRLGVGQRARRNRDAHRRQCPRHRAQRAMMRVALQHKPRPHAHPVGGVGKQPRRRWRHRLARRGAPTPRPGARTMDTTHIGRDLDLDELRHRCTVRRIGPRAVRTPSRRRLHNLLDHRQRRARCTTVPRRPPLLPPRPARTRRRGRRAASLRTTPALAAPPIRRLL